MSYVVKGRGSRVSPTKRAVDYHLRRERAEGFRKTFVQPTPLYELMKYMLIYPRRFEDFYYSSVLDYVNYLVSTVRDAAERYGWETVHRVSLIARRVGMIKDAPLIAAELYPGKEMIADLLQHYPVTKILLYAVLAKKKLLPVPWGRRKKSAIETVLNAKPVEWHELQAIKHRASFRDLLRIVHPRPATRELSDVWGWVVGRKPAPTPKIEAYVRAVGERDPNKAVEIALQHDLPWEVVRSRIGRLDAIEPRLLEEAAWTLMSPIDVVMQFGSLARRIGFARATLLLTLRMDEVPLQYLSNFAVNAVKLGWIDVAERTMRKLMERSTKVLAEISLLGERTYRNVYVLIDVSASMVGQGIERAAKIATALAPIATSFYVFSSKHYPPRMVKLENAHDLRNLMDMPGGGTPLLDSINWMLENVVDREDLLIVITDEQENVSSISTEEFNELLARSGRTLLAIAVGPYPTDFVAKRPLTNVVGVAASDVQGLIAGWRMVEMMRAQSEGIADEEFLRMIERAAERST